MENVTRVFGKGGLYDVVLNKTDWKVIVKTVAECIGIQLEGDDLVEVICNAILQNMPMDELQTIVNKGIKDGILETQGLIEDAMDEIQKEMRRNGVDLSVWSRAAQEALKAADFGQELHFNMFETQAGLVSEGGVFEAKEGTFAGDAFLNQSNSGSPKRAGGAANNQCSTDQERADLSSEYSLKYSHKKEADPQAQFLFFKSNKKYSSVEYINQAVTLWQKLLWIVQYELNYPGIVPKSFASEESWCDGKFGRETAAATKSFHNRAYVTFGDFKKYFQIDLNAEGAGTDSSRRLKMIQDKLKAINLADSGNRLSLIPGINSSAKLPIAADLRAGDYEIIVQRVGESSLTMTTDYMVVVRRFIVSSGKLTFSIVDTALVSSHAEAKAQAQSYYKAFKAESPSAHILVDTSALVNSSSIENIRSAAQGRDYMVDALKYLDPEKQTEILFNLAEDAGSEVSKILNKVVDRRQLCALLSDAIDEVLKFMQGDYGALEKIGRLFSGGNQEFQDSFRALMKNITGAVEDIFGELGRAMKNALIVALEAVIVGAIKIVLGYLLIACKFVQKALNI